MGEGTFWYATVCSFFSAAVVPSFAAVVLNRGTEGAERLRNRYRYSFLLSSAPGHCCDRSACTQPTVQHTRRCLRNKCLLQLAGVSHLCTETT